MAKATKSGAQGSGGESTAPHHVVRSIEATGGFLAGAHLELDPDGLNVIIGGHGSGKTSLLQLVRYGLDLFGRLAGRRLSESEAIVENGLSEGIVRLRLRTQNGVGYVAERAWDEPLHMTGEEGSETVASLATVFGADVYGQSEMEEIAREPERQIELIDRLARHDMGALEAELGRLLRDLTQNAAALTALENDISDLEERSRDVAALEKELAAIQRSAGPDAATLNEAHAAKALRERERRAIEALRVQIERARTQAAGVLGGIARSLEERVGADLRAGANADLLGTVADAADAARGAMKRSTKALEDELGGLEKTLLETERSLAARHAKQESAYRALLGDLEDESGKSGERSRLQGALAKAVEARTALDRLERDRRALMEERVALLASLGKRREQRSDIRRQVASTLTDALKPSIRVTVKQEGNVSAYRDLLVEALRGLNMKAGPLVEKITSKILPAELVAMVTSGNADTLADRAGIDEERAEKVVAALRGSQHVRAIEAVDLGDVPTIALSVGGEWKASTELSTGQRCTAILPILLHESERPLLIDQPEDNIDNRYIFETLVKALQRAKGRRQLIFVTHNPNIPVLGNAERVFVMASDGHRGWVEKVGTVDDVKADIELLLEGGREAFLERKKRYGH